MFVLPSNQWLYNSKKKNYSNFKLSNWSILYPRFNSNLLCNAYCLTLQVTFSVLVKMRAGFQDIEMLFFCQLRFRVLCVNISSFYARLNFAYKV